ncbi:MAG: SufD family Fe-S cluster assembly protein, partial [Mesorhizobium sp.]
LNGVSSTKLPAVDGVAVQRLSEKLTDGSAAPGLDLYGADDAIGALNTAFVADGYFVDIADRTELDKPIELQNLQAGGQTHVRLAVRVGAGAKAVIVERQAGEGAALVSSVSQLLLDEGADVTWLIVQEQPDTATHLAQFKAHLGKDSKLTLFVMNAGGRLVRQEVVVKTTGEGADFTLRGINLLAGDTHTDVTMVLDHAVPHTASTEVIRNVVTGRARGVFQGRINVHQYAQKTNAKMACNTLL